MFGDDRDERTVEEVSAIGGFGVGQIGGGAKVAASSARYSGYIEELWKISNEIETLLDPVLTGNNIQDDRTMPETTLLSDLERLTDRFRDIQSRIVI
jgi:hypothetical protein